MRIHSQYPRWLRAALIWAMAVSLPFAGPFGQVWHEITEHQGGHSADCPSHDSCADLADSSPGKAPHHHDHDNCPRCWQFAAAKNVLTDWAPGLVSAGQLPHVAPAEIESLARPATGIPGVPVRGPPALA